MYSKETIDRIARESDFDTGQVTFFVKDKVVLRVDAKTEVYVRVSTRREVIKN